MKKNFDFFQKVHFKTEIVQISDREFKINFLMNGTVIDFHGFKGFKELTNEQITEAEAGFINKFNL
jgi:hypothetical protein